MDILSQIGIVSTDKIISFILTLIFCAAAMKIITSIVMRLLDRSKIDNSLRNLFAIALKIGLWTLAVIIIADSVGISTASLVALLSVASLALSLSVQDIMSNVFSGIVILIFNKSFKIGDYVDIGSRSGVIEKIEITHTLIKTVDNKLVSIPNKEVASADIVNYSAEPLRRVDHIYCTDYADSIEDVRAAVKEAISMDDRIMQEPAPFIAIDKYGDSSIDYVVRVWCKTADYWDVYFGLNENIGKCFEKHNVHMTYNHINVHMLKD